MLKSDRRAFLKTMAQGSVAAGIALSFPSLTQSVFAQQTGSVPTNPPLNPVESALRQIKAEPWAKVDDRNVYLKGCAFDRKLNLTVSAAYPGPDPSKGMAGRVDRSILSISQDKKITTLISTNTARFTDHVLHKDGRLLIACLDGKLLMANPDGSDLKPVTARSNGRPTKMSGLTFDSKGYLYVSDFTGKPGDPTGAIFRWTPDFQTCEPFISNLVTPDGIAFAPDEKSVWVTCAIDQKLMRVELDNAGKAATHIESVYDMNGPGADGMRVDVLGNVYVAMNFQGRILVFNKQGKPIATVLMPGRDKGDLLSTANLEFKPGTDEVYAVAAGDLSGTWIYKFKALAKGVPRFSQQ